MKVNDILLIFLFSFVLLQCHKNDNKDLPLDSERFALEYPLVGDNNVFVYRTAEETADILENGRGIVFMGFKECPWCQLYAVFLHEVALEMEIKTIYYCDIKEDRESNSESYKRITAVLAGHLQYDDEGHPRVYVPDLSMVHRGRVIFHDLETSYETLGYDTPEDYWNDERANALKERLKAGIRLLNQSVIQPCNTC